MLNSNFIAKKSFKFEVSYHPSPLRKKIVKKDFLVLVCTKKIMRNPDIQNKMKCTADNTEKRFEVFETLKKSNTWRCTVKIHTIL